MSKRPPSVPPGASQKGPAAGAGARATERQGTQEAAKQTDRDEIIQKSSSPVKGVEDAKKYLERTCMTIADEPYTTRCLSLSLLHMTQAKGIGRDTIDGMRVVH